ncbi:MAG: class I SAM-dependent methyltransferase [Chitinophagaceae bacterium]|nr:MAG: class I SAM-dependent methyltransferase [Chitinophagaceae bacterium]
MYPRSVLLAKYIAYYLGASNSRGHGVHSPFVFDFIKHVLRDTAHYEDYDKIEAYRSRLHADRSMLQVTDFGAGSAHTKGVGRQVSQIASTALKPKKYAALLYRIARYYKPSTILELGTSLGITTGYLALAVPGAAIVTVEGAKSVANIASAVFKEAGLNNIKLITGNFDQVLPGLLPGMNTIDFVFMDGNHRYAPTIKYFTELLPVIHEYTIVVLDDIHWSAEMERAWLECRKHPRVTLSIDLFFIGILFFRKEFRVPQHFSIRF